jgi:signal transduction histidine kinase
MRRYKLTWIGLAIAVAIAVTSNVIDFDPFAHLVRFFDKMEHYEIDELFVGALIFLVFFTVDLLRLQREQKVEHEKNKVYKAMIASSHHILNNFLNQMQLFKITAESTPGFDQEILAMYDTIMKEASDQIKELSNISEISETSIKEAVMPKSGG